MHGGMTESEWRREVLKGYMRDRLLYARLEFDPMEELHYHPAVSGKPAEVAKWLRELADDIEKLEEK